MVINDYYIFEYQFMWRAKANNQARWGVYGVIHATNEFVLRYGWTVEYITMHPLMMSDIALRRPLTG